MKILIAHNWYQHGGGEDVAASTEAQLLSEHGHEITWYRRSNHELGHKRSLHALLSIGISTVWSSTSYLELTDILRRVRPDVAHFHNTFPLISPAAYFACANAGVPVVQTLHNYRLLCPAATFFRDGHICEECLGRAFTWPGIRHACYHQSASATAAVAAMELVHRMLRTWQTKIDSYIAASEFARGKFIEGGLPAERIRVKPNFVHPDPGPKRGRGEYALFVGRLSDDKGLHVLLEAWKRVKAPIPLLVAGEGAMSCEDSEIAHDLSAERVKFLGPVAHREIPPVMHNARFLIFPSILYEGAFPLSILEAFACGLPVIASRLGSMREGIADGQNGMHFSPGDSADFAARIEWACAHPNELLKMGLAARAEYEAKYTADRNYEVLMSVYGSVLRNSSDTKAHHSVYGNSPSEIARVERS